MTWFNWHEPLITPAQGFYIFAACLAGYVVARVVWRFIAGPATQPELYEHVDGEGR